MSTGIEPTPGHPSSTLLEAAIMQAYNAVVITDATFANGGPVIEFCNDAFCRMTGYPRAELLGRSPRILQGPDTDAGVIARLRECLHERRFFEGSTINYRKDGTPYVVQWNITPVLDPNGELRHFVSVQQDVTTRVEAERDRDLMARALHESADPILITDEQHRVLFVNRAFEALTGFAAAEIMGENPSVLYAGDDLSDRLADRETAVRTGEPLRTAARMRTRDGNTFHAECTTVPVADRTTHSYRLVTTLRDVTDVVHRTERLHELAMTDTLTGLPNRRAGDLELEARHAEAGLLGRPFSVVVADIDHFKAVNDTHGHAAGDDVLVAVAQTLRATARSDDLVVRWGGEEFVVVMAGASLEAAERLAERLRTAVAERGLPGVGSVTLSCGVAAAGPGEPVQELLERADDALYAAKSAGRNRVAVAAAPLR